MRRSRLAIAVGLAMALMCAGLPGVSIPRHATAVETRPNIVMFYLDDMAAHDARLWSNPALTPNIYHQFVEHGIRFTNAFGESPLCCPGRASLLTGLHTHNNGVYRNNIHFLHPTANVATELQGVGYSTNWLGKYLNVFNKTPADDWAQYAKPWTQLEATYDFTDRVRTASGWKTTGMHPTRYITDRAVQLINAAGADQPFFTVLAPFNIHYPNRPVSQPPEVFAQCDSIPPWNPPNYNEADVTDKPAYIASRPLLAATDGWSLVNYCKEMFGVDQMVGDVIDALDQTGRLDNTLLIFTADNGMNWGAHRLGAKSTAHATPVPLYMSWPHRWGVDQRDIAEYVTNIDLAPTFCDIAGCELGPYPSGQAGPDGLSMLPLIDGDVDDLGRDALLETIDGTVDAVERWSGVRTTPLNALGLWHYVEYAGGEKELYDLDADPWELDNVAGDPAYSETQAALATRLRELRQVGRVNAPDLSVFLGVSLFNGYNIIGTDVSLQTERVIGLPRGATRDVSLQLENNSTSADTITLRATLTNKPAIRIKFLVDGVDNTAALLGTGYEVSYGDTERHTYLLRVTIGTAVKVGARRTMLVTARSSANNATDVVRLIAGR